MLVDSAAVMAAGLMALARVSGAHPYETGPPPLGARRVELGPRPEYLVNDMDESPLKDELAACLDRPVRPSRFSIGHRGGSALQFPEETRQAYVAGTRMGAGIHECDVAFTRDRQLVCRHAQCDLHMTTNILATDLADRCSEPFVPAAPGRPASARCCTSDLTLAEFKTLCGKMEGVNASAVTVEDFLGGTRDWRTTLYSQCGEVSFCSGPLRGAPHLSVSRFVDSWGTPPEF
jgi:glycerophosphoryl diester phosphodiesterase